MAAEPLRSPGKGKTAGEDFGAWIGREMEVEDYLEPNRANALRATLEARYPPLAEGDALPPLWHWCYFWEHALQSAIARDGHAGRGGFLPPVPLPRRMWAGSTVTWMEPLRLGMRAVRTSRIESVERKEGRSGTLFFVTILHRVHDRRSDYVLEHQNLVYREAAKPGSAVPPGGPQPAEPTWLREVEPTAPLLFRYSALTFNSHRIHYDLPYAREVEGYQALVVHGPLLATLMVDLAAREEPEADPQSFRFRALAPIFSSSPFTVCGAREADGARLWVHGPAGTSMDGQITWR